MNALQYLLQVNLYLIFFYGFYVLLLRNETFFALNRIYLIITALLSFAIPGMQSEWIRAIFVTEEVMQVSAAIHHIAGYQSQPAAFPMVQLREDTWAVSDWFITLYIAGVVFFMGRMLFNLFSLLHSQQNSTAARAYSFFKKVVVSEDLEDRATIYQHEKVHAMQWHSADVLLFEIIAVVNWFNPVVYACKQSIKSIHEFIADEEAAKLQPSKETYAMLLVSNVFGMQANQLSNNFYKSSLLKKRIIMLHKTKSKKVAILKYGLSAPLFAVMLVLSSATVETGKVEAITEQIGRTAIQGSAETLADEPAYKTQQKEYTAFLKRNPSIKHISWSGATDFINIHQKSGKTERYNLHAAKEVKAAEAKYGKLPIAPPPPPKPRVSRIRFPDEAVKTSNAARAANAGTNGTGDSSVLSIRTRNGSQPLIIVDGKMIENIPAGFNPSTADEKAYADLTGIKSADIQDITVLKDAAAIAKYGERGANGVLLITTKNAENQQDKGKVFERVEVLPTFPGGNAAWTRFISQNFKYPIEAQKNGVSGRIFLSFIVEKDGSLTDIKIVRDLGMGTGEEARRVLSKSPKWEPGMQDGIPVRVAYTMPIMLNFQPNK